MEAEIYVINIYNVTTTQFEWRKNYVAGSGSVQPASSEDFYWIAIGQIP